MAWFKVDDGLHSSRKFLSIPKRSRFAAIGVWAIAGAWCADQLTDGHVPDYMLEVWGVPPSAPLSLVQAGLWERESGGYVFCNWLEYQPRKADVDAEREASRERMRDLRAKRKQNKPQDNAELGEVFGRTVTNCSENVRNPVPSRPSPDPTLVVPTESVSLGSNCPVDNLTDDSANEANQAANRLAARHGYELKEIVHAVLDQCGREIGHGEALALAHHLIGKCSGPVNKPQRYVIGAIRKSPLEVQQFIDREVA